jgi:hypothetical protein
VSIEYAIRVFLPTVGVIDLTPALPLFSVDEFSVAPDGNALEATFRCVPSKLLNTSGNPATIAVRSNIYIQTRPTGGTFTTRWSGFVVLAGNPYSDNVETFRAVGFKKAFYETVLGRTISIAAGDVAAQANEIRLGVLDSNNNVGGWSLSTPDMPTLGFTAGRYFPLLQTAGDALDALAATVGRFIVPAGETYTYDGVTFTAGQLVPPVTWGMRASLTSSLEPKFFFRRSFANIGSVAETDLNAQVDWPAISAEKLNTRPVIQYFPNMDWSVLTNPRITFPAASEGPLLLPVAQPMIYSSQSIGQTQAVVELPNPSNFLVPNQNYSSLSAPEDNSTFNDVSDAFDGDSTTAATGTYFDIIQYQVNTAIPASNQNLTVGQAAVRVDVEYSESIGFQIDIGHNYSFVFSTARWTARYIAPPLIPESPATTITRRVKFDLPVLIPVEFAEVTKLIGGGTGNYRVSVLLLASDGSLSNTGTLSVYDLRLHTPTAASNTVAEQLVETFRIPNVAEAADVKIFGVEPVRTRIDLTPAVGGVLQVPVERVTYSITTTEGVTTTYHAGQAFDGELVTERVVLEGLARRASRTNI